MFRDRTLPRKLGYHRKGTWPQRVRWAKAAGRRDQGTTLTRRAHAEAGEGVPCGRGHGGSASYRNGGALAAFAHPRRRGNNQSNNDTPGERS
jgi:hypothetical protein